MRARYPIMVAGLAVAFLAVAPAAVASAPATAVTPNPSAPGTDTSFGITCPGASSATLFGTTLGLAEQIPMLNAGQGDFIAVVTLPKSIQPGTYQPDADCSNGVSATISVTVNAVPGQAPQTGDGATSTATNQTLTDAGVALAGAGAAAAVGFWARRRFGGGA